MDEKIDLYIVSRGRYERCFTLESLGDVSAIADVKLVVHFTERGEYLPLAKKHGVELVEYDYESIGHKRQIIGKNAADKFIVMDDDLTFFKRKSETDWHLRKLKVGESSEMLASINEKLDYYAHVGVSAREGQNRLESPFVYTTRYMRVLGYRKKEYMQCQHNRVQFMEDFDINLQLLRKGYQSCVTTTFAQNQVGTQMKGGCSEQRTIAKHEQSAKKLAELHHPFVKLRQKRGRIW